MMKYVFVLSLLVVGAMGAGLALNVAIRWTHDMARTQVVRPGEMAFSMPPGSVSRGGELYYPKDERDAAATRKNPFPSTPASVAHGAELFTIYCTPCHGSGGKGDGLVATKFVSPPDLTNPELQKSRTDGFWQSYLSVGGAIMPAYGEALSPEERWQIVDYLRTLPQK